MKPRKIKITPKNPKAQSSDKSTERKSSLGNENNRGTGGSGLVIKPKREGYDKLKEENQNIQEDYKKFKRNAIIIGGALVLALLIVTAVLFLQPEKPLPTDEDETISRYGYNLDAFQIRKDIVQSGQIIDDILISYNVPTAKIPEVRARAKSILNVDSLQEKARLTVLSSDKDNETKVIIYEPNPYEYIAFDLGDTTEVFRVERKKEIKLETASGIIDSVLWKTILDKDLHYDLIGKMEQALQWSIDFHHLKAGDRFKLVYEHIYADGEAIEIGELKAVYFRTQNKVFDAYYFEEGDVKGFFDGHARPMKRSFLLSPVKYARISSAFNLNRKHPVLKTVKPHLGTDYAAPEGTPILAVADGVISIAAFGKNNGNYVKIRHDKVYESQYLHMSKFAPGIKKGTRVKQGEVIGFVGSTGLSSGPHVCFRFWKNKQQVDHRAENLPSPEPLPGGLASIFLGMKDPLEQKLTAISYN